MALPLDGLTADVSLGIYWPAYSWSVFRKPQVIQYHCSSLRLFAILKVLGNDIFLPKIGRMLKFVIMQVFFYFFLRFFLYRVFLLC